MLELEAYLPHLHFYWIPKLDVSLCCRHCFGTGSTAEFRLFRYFDNHLTMILTQHEIYDTSWSTFLMQKNIMLYFSTIMILLPQHNCLLHKKLCCNNVSATIALTVTSSPTMLLPGLVFEKVHHFHHDNFVIWWSPCWNKEERENITCHSIILQSFSLSAYLTHETIFSLSFLGLLGRAVLGLDVNFPLFQLGLQK